MAIEFKLGKDLTDQAVLEVTLPSSNRSVYSSSDDSYELRKIFPTALQTACADFTRSLTPEQKAQLSSVKAIHIKNYDDLFTYYDGLPPLVTAMANIQLTVPILFYKKNDAKELHELKDTSSKAADLWAIKTPYFAKQYPSTQETQRNERSFSSSFGFRYFIGDWIIGCLGATPADAKTGIRPLEYSTQNTPEQSLLWQLAGSLPLKIYLDMLKASGHYGTQPIDLFFTDFVYGTRWEPYSNLEQDLLAFAECPYFPFTLVLPQRSYSEKEFLALLKLIKSARSKIKSYGSEIPKDLYHIHLSDSRFTPDQLGRIFTTLEVLKNAGEEFCILSGFQEQKANLLIKKLLRYLQNKKNKPLFFLDRSQMQSP